MRKILVTFDDDLDKVLSGKPNQSEFIREAVRLYNGNISTDTLAGMRQAYIQTQGQIKELHELMNQAYELMERLDGKIPDQFAA